MWLPPACPPLGTRPATQACALTGNRTSDPLGHRLTLNPLSYTSQGKTGHFKKKRISSFIFRERREGEKVREKHRCVRETSIVCLLFTPKWGSARNPGMCPDRELNQRPFRLQAGAQFTEPHQPG